MTNERGFSLAELLVVVAVLGLILAGVLALQQQGQLAYIMGSNRVEAQQNARIAITIMSRELREACALTSLPSATNATNITFTMVDPTKAVSVDCSSAVAGDVVNVRYALSGTTLYRDVATGALPAIGSGAPLIGGVTSLGFTGYLSNNSASNTLASAGNACGTTNVCSVEITLQTSTEESVASYSLGNVRATLPARVRVRNL